MLGAIAAASYGLNPLFALPLYGAGLGVDSVLFYRYVLAVVMLGALMLFRRQSFALRRRDVPYRIYSGHSFYDRKEIKDLVAYFRLIVNPRDNEALRRIINTPARGIGAVTVARVAAVAAERGVSMWEVLEGTGSEQVPELKTAAKKTRRLHRPDTLPLARTEHEAAP